jgi:pyridoxal/pyridoxine/pyridoxamine kinase
MKEHVNLLDEIESYLYNMKIQIKDENFGMILTEDQKASIEEAVEELKEKSTQVNKVVDPIVQDFYAESAKVLLIDDDVPDHDEL